MNWKPLLTTGLTIATSLLAGAGVTYTVVRPEVPKDIVTAKKECTPVTVILQLKHDPQHLDVTVHGAAVKK